MSKEINLEWYVLNGRHTMKSDKEEFDKYPYCFHQTEVRPWNVFNNWVFEEAAVKLAKDYYKGKMSGWEHCDDFPKGGSPYEQFKFRLMRELASAENGRCEYEICVADWSPVYLNKEGKRISVYYGQEHEPIDDILIDKIDCYVQVLPNADLFAKYVLMIVNGTLETKAEKTKYSKPKNIEGIPEQDGKVYKYGTCSKCKTELQGYEKYCHNCGQKLDWR